MTHKLNRLTALVLAVVMAFSVLLVPASAASFHDVSENAWYKAAVDYVQEKGWMAGVSETSFAPNKELTRGMMVTVLARVAEAETNNETAAFTDTASGKWFTGAAAWAAENGIAAGVGEGLFAPNRALTRQDLCVMLYKYISLKGYELENTVDRTFSDMESVSDYARDAVIYCTGTGLVSGFEDSSFRPRATATRAQVAQLMMRLDLLVKGETAPTEPMPAQSFEGEAGEDMAVSVNAPEGALPENTKMTVSRVTDEAALAAIQAKVNGELYAAADITFTKDSAELEPEKAVEVQISLDGLENIEHPTVVHVLDDGSVEYVAAEVISTDRAGTDKALRFYAKDFSVYAVIDDPSGNNAFTVTVNFYVRTNKASGPDGSDSNWELINKQIIRSNQIDAAKDNDDILIFDPGVPALETTQAFEGWARTKTFTDSDDKLSVADMNANIKADYKSGTLNASVERSFYAEVYDVVYITYHDQAGAVLETESIHAAPGTTSISFVFDRPYTPFKGDQKFFGWIPSGYVTAAGEYPTYAADAAEKYFKADGTTASTVTYATGSNNVDVYPYLAQGFWLIFDTNISVNNNASHNNFNDSTSASYTEPKLYLATDTTTAPAVPTRTGYTFGGWYSDADMTRAFTWGTRLTKDTTVYAKWTPTYTDYYVNIWVQSDQDRADDDVSNNKYDFLYQYKYSNKKTGDSVSISSSSYSLTSVLSAIGDSSLTNAIGGTGHYTVSSNSVTSVDHISGNGSTALDIKYDRNKVTMYFRNSTGGTLSSSTYYYYRVNDGAGDYKLPDSAYPSGYYLVGTGPNASSTPSTYYYYYYYSTRPSSASQIDQYFEETLPFSSRTSYTSTYGGYYYYYDSSNGYFPLYYYYNNDSAYVADTSDDADYRLFNGKLEGLYGARVYGWPDANKYGPSSSSYDQWYGIQGSSSNNYSNTDFSMTIPVTSFKYVYSNYDSLETWYWYAQAKSLSSYNTTRWYTENVNGTYSQTATGRFDGTLTFGDSLFYGFSTLGYNFSNSTLASTVSNPTYTSTSGTTVSYNSSYDYLYIYYARNKWRISYFNGSSEITSLRKTNVPYEQNISGYNEDVSALAPEGYYFDGWYKDSTLKEPFNWDTTMPNANVTVYAKWTKIRFRTVLDYNADGDTITFPGNQADSFRLDYGEQVRESAIMAAERDGYVLLGWYYKENGTGDEKEFNFAMGANESMADMSYATASDTERQGTYKVPGVKDSDGNLLTSWTDVGLPNVRGKIVIYAKWREDPDGVIGMRVKYYSDNDPDTGYFAPDTNKRDWLDPNIYVDQAKAYAQPASTPDNTAESFLYWEILDKDGNPTGRIAYPGQTWDVYLRDAVEEKTLLPDPRCDHSGSRTHHDAVAATCTEAGSVEYWKCDNCGKCFDAATGGNLITNVTTDPLGHNWGTPTYTWNPATDLPVNGTVTCTGTAVCGRDSSHTVTETVTAAWVVDTAATTAATGAGHYEATFTNTAAFTNQNSASVTIPKLTGYPVHFSVPDGITQPEDMLCLPDDSITLPTADAPTGYSFLGWSASVVPETTTVQTPLTGSYSTNAEVTLYALYTRTGTTTETVYQLVNSAPSDWTGRYVITGSQTDGNYAVAVMAGVSDGTTYENASTNGDYAFENTGIVLDSTNNRLTNVDNLYVFDIAKYSTTSYYTIQNVSTETYLYATNSGTLNAHTTNTDAASRWALGMTSSGSYPISAQSQISSSTTTYRYISYVSNSSTSGDYMFALMTSASTYLFFWKQTTVETSTTFYTTEIEGYTLTFSVPEGTTAVNSMLVPQGSTVTLPTASAPSGYTFVGWVTSDVADQTTLPSGVQSGSYTVNADADFIALYSHELVTGKTFTRLSSLPSDMTGNYLFTYGTDSSLYILKGLYGNTSYESLEYGGAVSLANSGATLSGSTLSGVGDIYAFAYAASGSYATFRNLATETYLSRYATSSDALLAALNTSFTNYSSYIQWTPAISGGKLTLTSSLPSTVGGESVSDKYPVLGFTTSNNTFWVDGTGSTSTTNIYLWKETADGNGTHYTTSPEAAADSYIVSYSVPSGVSAVSSQTVSAGDSILLPNAGAPSGYYFWGWSETNVTDTATAPAYHAWGSVYTPASSVELKAVYVYDDVYYKRLTAAESSSYTGYYVISSGTNLSSYMMGTTTGNYSGNNNAKTLMSSVSGLTLTNDELRGVPDANVIWFSQITTSGYTDYYALENDDDYYLQYNSSNLTTTTTLNTTSIWKPIYNNGRFNLQNNSGSSYYISYYNNYFTVRNSTNYGVYLWKRYGVPHYVTASGIGSNAIAKPVLGETEIEREFSLLARAQIETQPEQTAETPETEAVAEPVEELREASVAPEAVTVPEPVRATTTVASWDFETNPGWTFIDSDGDGYEWTRTNSNTEVHGGEYALRSNSYIGSSSSGGSALTPDNWAFTSAVAVPAEGTTTMTFWVHAQDEDWPGDILRVYAGTSASVSSMTALTADITAGEWTQITVDLTAYAGQTIYIGFRHYNCTDYFAVVIDDVVITNEVTETPVTYTVTFVDYDGTELSKVENITGGNTVAQPADPTREEYYFVSWQLNGADFDFNTPITGNITLTATYTPMYAKTFTVRLRAVYGMKNTTGKTHIYWYANDGTTAGFGEGAGDRYEQTDLTMNLPYNIPTPTTWTGKATNGKLPEIEHRVFLGWARKQTVGSGVTGTAYPDLTEEDLYLKWNAAEGKYYYLPSSDKLTSADIGGANPNDWMQVTQVYADEGQPYHDFYAVWASYAYVFHSASGKLEAVEITRTDGLKNTVDLVNKVPSDCLYGGYYTEYGGVKNVTAADMQSAQRASVQNAYSVDHSGGSAERLVAVNGAVNYTGAMSYSSSGSSVKFWTRAKAYGYGNQAEAPSGRRLVPEVGEVYYLKEVPETYLTTKFLYTYDKDKENEIQDFFMLTLVDDSYYSRVGFRTVENAETVAAAATGEIVDRQSLAGYFTLTQKNHDPVTINAASFGLSSGYVGIKQYNDYIAAGKSFSLMPAWETYDGVEVNSHGTLKLTVDEDKTSIEYSPMDSVTTPFTTMYVKLNDNVKSDWLYYDENDHTKLTKTRLYFFNDAEGKNTWVEMTSVDGTDNSVWTAPIPEGNWEAFIVVRCNPDNTLSGWDARWNQTGNITFNSREFNLVTITGSSSGYGSNYNYTTGVYGQSNP